MVGGPTKEEGIDRAHLLEALEVGLMDALPGIELLDRDLRFDAIGHADLAAVDPTGRLVLVFVASGDPGQSVLEVLDVLAYARENATLVGRHLGSRRIDPGFPPRIVVIDPNTDEVLLRRLGCLASAGVDLFTVRNVASAAGERSYLIAAGPSSHSETFGGGEGGVQAFLDALPLPLRDVGQELTDRMARLDEELFATTERRALVWRFHGEILARLVRDRDGLTVTVAPSHWPAPLRGVPDVEGILEDALACLALELENGGERPAGRQGVGREDLPLIARDEPLLTNEEIEAFRD